MGRTADEILDIASQLYGAIQRGETITPAQPTVAPSPAPMSVPSPSPNDLPMVDPDLIYSNPGEYHRQMEARMNAILDARLQAAESSVVPQIASMAKTQAQSYRPDVWSRYGPEIESTMAQMPATSRSDVQVWQRIVNYVAGLHVDEIAEARAQEMLSRGDSGMLQTSGAPPSDSAPSSANPIKKLFEDRHPAVKGFIDDGISVDQVMKHAVARGHTPEAYAKMLTDRVERKGVAVR